MAHTHPIARDQWEAVAKAEAIEQRDIKVGVPAYPVFTPHDLPQRIVNGREWRLPHQIVRMDAVDVVSALMLCILFEQFLGEARGDQGVIRDRRAVVRRKASHGDGDRLIQFWICAGCLSVEGDSVLGAERIQRVPPVWPVQFPNIRRSG